MVSAGLDRSRGKFAPRQNRLELIDVKGKEWVLLAWNHSRGKFGNWEALEEKFENSNLWPGKMYWRKSLDLRN